MTSMENDKTGKKVELGVWKQSCSELFGFGQPETHNTSVLWSEQQQQQQ